MPAIDLCKNSFWESSKLIALEVWGGSKLVSRATTKKKRFPITFTFFHGFKIFFFSAREASVHKVEQSECSAGISHRDDIAHQKGRDDSPQRYSRQKQNHLHIWKLHWKIIFLAIKMCLLLAAADWFQFLHWVCENLVWISTSPSDACGRVSLNVITQKKYIFGSRSVALKTGQHLKVLHWKSHVSQ